MGGIGACYCCCALAVVLINIVLLILGLVLTALGGVLMWGQSLLDTYVKPMLSGMMSSASGGGGLDLMSLINDLLDLIKPVAIGLFIFGIIIVVVAFCGVFGPCCKSKCLLGTYVIIAAIVFICELAFLILFLTKRDEYMKEGGDYFKKEINDKYTGVNGTDFISFAVNALQALMSCCGVTNGSDFNAATKWQKTFTYTKDGYSKNITLDYPVTCCKLKNFKPIDSNCTFDAKDSNSNYKIGCFKKIDDMTKQYMMYVNAAVGGITGLQALLLIFGLLMFYHVISEGRSSVKPAKF